MRSKHLTSHCSDIHFSEFSFSVLCWPKISEMHFPSLMPGFASGIRWAFLCEENKNRFTPPLFTFQKRLTNLKKNKKGIPLNCIFIDQLELTSRTYNCLKRANIHTLLDLLSKTEEDLLRIDSFRMEDRKHIWDTLEKHLPIDLLKNKLSF